MGKPLDAVQLMQYLMDNIKDNIYFMDREGRIMMINQAGVEWLGYKHADELIGKTDLDIFTDEHGRKAYEDEQEIMRSGIPILGKEEKETWADGHVTWVSTSKMPLRDEDGNIVGTFGISRDITARKKAELRAAKYAEENKRIRDEMEEDMRMAAELQKTFFPSSYPQFLVGMDGDKQNVINFFHHRHTGSLVGGDFCCIEKISDTEACIFMCDVMGHGVRAALGTAIVCAMVQEILSKVNDPGSFLRRMNNALLPILRQEDLIFYATACCLMVDVSTGLVRFANAGHPMPIHLDGQTKKAAWFLEDHSLCGPALAICEGVDYLSIDFPIKPNDSVVLFTDGIFEVADASDQEFGEERLLSAVQRGLDLPLKELFPSLLNEACNFAASGAFDDDVCLAGFKLDGLF